MRVMRTARRCVMYVTVVPQNTLRRLLINTGATPDKILFYFSNDDGRPTHREVTAVYLLYGEPVCVPVRASAPLSCYSL